MFTWTRIKLNTNLTTPLFQQVVDWFTNAISKGILKEGERIPSEIELCRIFCVSRITIRHALTKLQNDGYITRERPKGTYVASREITFQYISESIGLGEDLTRKKVDIKDKVLNCKVISADQKISNKLGIDIDDHVFYLERLRIIKGEPLIISRNYIFHEMVPEIEKIDFTKNFLYSVLEERYEIKMNDFVRSFEPILLNKPEQELFGLEPGNYPAFKIESISYDSNNRLIEYYEGIQRGKLGKVTIRSKGVSSLEEGEIIHGNPINNGY